MRGEKKLPIPSKERRSASVLSEIKRIAALKDSGGLIDCISGRTLPVHLKAKVLGRHAGRGSKTACGIRAHGRRIVKHHEIVDCPKCMISKYWRDEAGLTKDAVPYKKFRAGRPDFIGVNDPHEIIGTDVPSLRSPFFGQRVLSYDIDTQIYTTKILWWETRKDLLGCSIFRPYLLLGYDISKKVPSLVAKDD